MDADMLVSQSRSIMLVSLTVADIVLANTTQKHAKSSLTPNTCAPSHHMT
jgi:hypothetical protein